MWEMEVKEMSYDSASSRFREYLKKIEDIQEDKCWFCHKSPEDIKKEYYEYMKHPSEEFEDVDIDDIIIMTYKMLKPICAGCYFTMKHNADLVKEILKKPEDEVWS